MRKPQYIPAVYIVVKDAADRVLMLERYKTGYCDGQLTLPAGHVETGEKIVGAAIRELQEEVGIVLNENDLEMVHVMRRQTSTLDSYIDFYFAARVVTNEVSNREPAKSRRILWCDEDALPDETIDHVKAAVQSIRRGVRITEIAGCC